MNERPPLRIGNDERNAAIKALDEHLAAGRIDHEEYGERMAAASMAKTREDLETLFVDLPAPRPFPAHGAPPWATPAYVPPMANQYTRPARPVQRRPGMVAALGAVMLMLAPVIALALFSITHIGIVWLVIPLAFMLSGGGRRARRGGGPFGWGCHSARRW